MPQNRDVDADYLAAYIAEYESYKFGGLDEQARAVAAELSRLGHEVRPKPPAEAKERAVVPPPVERAVEKDEPPKRPVGRPVKDK